MSKKESFIENFKGNKITKKDGFISSFIQYDKNIDPAEQEKINKLKIKSTLGKFLIDNTVD